MAGEVEETREEEAPRELAPLAKLGWQIRRNKYKPTTQETEVLQKCVDDARWYYLNGTLVSGAVAWNFSGIPGKLSIIPRLLMTATAAVIGREISGRFAGYSCMEKIIALEGSPLQGELIAILQEDYPNHPLLKATRAEHRYSLPLSVHEPEDYGHEGSAHVPPRDWASQRDDSTLQNRNWPGMPEHDVGDGSGRSLRIPRIWENSSKTDNVKKELDGADVFADPFDLVMQTSILGDSNSATEKEKPVERRRSRMSAKEKREYDRRQYEQRKEHHNY